MKSIMKKKVLAANTHAVEGMPLQLIIVAVVLAITIPLMFGALRTYDKSKVEQELNSEIDNFIGMAKLAYTSGPGNSAIVEFRAAKGTFTSIDYVRFGAEPDNNFSSVIQYKLNNRPEVLIVVESPNVPMMSLDNSTFEIQPGEYKIMIECRSSQSDLNGDGLSPDNFIQLSLSGV